MYIKLFDLEGGKVTPSIHCHTIVWLKRIMEAYPTTHNQIFAYLQYMCSWNPDDNPYLAMNENEKEETILKDIGATFSVEDELILDALEQCKKLFDNPVHKSWVSAKKGLEKLQQWLDDTMPTSGKDGNIKDWTGLYKDMPNIRSTYNQTYKDFNEEVKIQIRGDKFNSMV